MIVIWIDRKNDKKIQRCGTQVIDVQIEKMIKGI